MPSTGETPPVPRPEYPRPQFVRRDWMCLNGLWQFEVDRSDSGLERGVRDRPLGGQILVPFCPESSLSGVDDVNDFLNAVWYRRSVEVPAEWAGRRLLLHFGAVDYDTTVWANGTEVGRHRGGFTPFTFELTDVVEAGHELTLVVRARDEGRGAQARGKQSRTFGMFGPIYGRTTGIWQTVWLEPVPPSYLLRPRITPQVAAGAFDVELPVAGPRHGLTVAAVLSDRDGEVATATAPADLDFTARLRLAIPEGRRHLWDPDDPYLFDLRLELRDGQGGIVDALDSYAGLRAIAIDGHAVTLNGRAVFQRLVLDQGYYPDGIMTAPDDGSLVRDIELSLAAGFNGARLHQKVFEERFLYHADHLGYLVWGEFPDWGHEVVDGDRRPDVSFVSQWLESVERDYSHPAIVGWCPLNETSQTISDRITTLDDVTRALFLATKAADPTRPVLDASGYAHRVAETDIYDSHDYEQKPATFAQHMARLAEGHPHTNRGLTGAWSLPYRGQPYFCSEFGGIWWAPGVGEQTDSWGYGARPKSEAEFYQRFEGLTAVLLDNPDMFGYCYTQLTDVFQEQNGIYRFDRTTKLDVNRIRAIQRRPAAIERLGAPSPT